MINNRLSNIKEYHFKSLEKIKEEVTSRGYEVIDLGIGDPDLRVHESIINGIIEGLKIDGFNNYPPYDGIVNLKKEIIKYYREVFSVCLTLDEIIILIGSKEGISNLIPAICSIGDYVIVPDPAYPVYEACSYLWGCIPYKVVIKEKNNFQMDFNVIPEKIIENSKLIIINYPNNPTGAIADEAFYKNAIDFCWKNNIILCNDGAYNEIVKEKENPISLLQYGKGKKVIEFGSFSKTFNMTGFRVGFAVGDREIIKSLLKVKSNVDSSQFKPIQQAAINALKINREYIKSIRRIYDERRRITEEILKEKNIQFYNHSRSFYLWCKIPKGYTTEEFCLELLLNFGIIVTPGNAFGDSGEGYFRISLTKDKDHIIKFLKAIKVYN
ncbi:LL-diaminopimelate aminotransferase [Clostridium homopropionicum DSM 5847]|uniref:Aminotransferase n=1 Tax=Clostridium homopropionicum DSM 5847 TaxID=1121318 RepID=A0A0L6ZC16_9CLOT|nr:aminotransferase class I/II-fold pyridoxal phosphate-dependent enzyme [Clostridium homopropionicum]KOA20515.1 LL-diaminopimelate aminotransferase [Clostridium homopropionicum DSM 5847]SFG37377.1 LL-diaminopimelate aminotransferase apoenzyme [Clostridium homopropionicum]